MLKTNLFDLSGQPKGEVDLPESLFGVKPREHHLWRSVTTHLANQRLGTVKTKRKGEVSGGGKKPFKQKGTGNARQGSIRAVQFVGGGIAHGPKPRDYSKALPKKMKRQALAESLSDKAKQGKILVVEKMQFETPKTKQARLFLNSLGLEGKKCLLVLDQNHLPTIKSFRNLPKTKVIFRENLNTYEIVNHEFLVLTQETLKQLVVPTASKLKEKAL